MKHVAVSLLIGIEILACLHRVGCSSKATTRCEDLDCENNNPCRTTVSQSDNDDTSAECFCQGRWTGRLCELELVLSAKALTRSSVKVDVQARKPLHGKQNGDPTSPRKYTLMYWNNSTDRACSMVQELASPSCVIDGLVPEMHYTFCSETGTVEFCEVSKYSSNLPSNCVKVLLTNVQIDSVNRYFTTVGIGVGLSVVFSLLVLVIVISIILVKRQHCLPFSVVLDSCKCVLCLKRNTSAQNHILISEPPIYRGPRRQELSPSKTNTRPANRAKSYGTNPEPSKSLTTLLEDGEEAVVEGETSLTEPLTSKSDDNKENIS